ncbi:Lrp/AsnC family transcriptional regulator [Arthrobacter sp. UYCu723]
MSSSAKNIRPGVGAGEPLDAIDERLLAALVADARISNKQLAELVGIAPSTALMRTRALGARDSPRFRSPVEPGLRLCRL